MNVYLLLTLSSISYLAYAADQPESENGLSMSDLSINAWDDSTINQFLEICRKDQPLNDVSADDKLVKDITTSKFLTFDFHQIEQGPYIDALRGLIQTLCAAAKAKPQTAAQRDLLEYAAKLFTSWQNGSSKRLLNGRTTITLRDILNSDQAAALHSISKLVMMSNYLCVLRLIKALAEFKNAGEMVALLFVACHLMTAQTSRSCIRSILNMFRNCISGNPIEEATAAFNGQCNTNRASQKTSHDPFSPLLCFCLGAELP